MIRPPQLRPQYLDPVVPYNHTPRYCHCGARLSGYNPESECDPCGRALRTAKWEAEAIKAAMQDLRMDRTRELKELHRQELSLHSKQEAMRQRIERRRRPRGNA